MKILAADIGGTKVILQLSNPQQMLLEQEYKSAAYGSFDAMLDEFLAQVEGRIDVACLGVAGPIDGQQAKVTNLPWQLDAQQLQQRFAIGKVILINDFQAVGFGISALPQNALEVLQSGHECQHGVRALIGAGTGLGQAIMVWNHDHYDVLPTEGGHVDFAPTDDLQMELWRFMRLNSYRVTYEELVSGKGLVAIFNFLRERTPGLLSQRMAMRMINEDPAAVIAEYALETPDTLANEAMALFLKIYGAQVGNHALNTLPYGGLYIAGGIAPKLIKRIRQSDFLNAYGDKAPMAELMPKFPLMVIMEPRVGLLGAREVALREKT